MLKNRTCQQDLPGTVATLVALYEKDSAGKGVEGALRVLEAALARPAVSKSPPTYTYMRSSQGATSLRSHGLCDEITQLVWLIHIWMVEFDSQVRRRMPSCCVVRPCTGHGQGSTRRQRQPTRYTQTISLVNYISDKLRFLHLCVCARAPNSGRDCKDDRAYL
jgi:hypothetical protein